MQQAMQSYWFELTELYALNFLCKKLTWLLCGEGRGIRNNTLRQENQSGRCWSSSVKRQGHGSGEERTTKNRDVSVGIIDWTSRLPVGAIGRWRNQS